MDEYCSDGGPMEWLERNCQEMKLAIIFWLCCASFAVGYKVGQSHVSDRIPELLAQQRLKTIHETVKQVNTISKNRHKYERLKFRASEWGAGLDMP